MHGLHLTRYGDKFNRASFTLQKSAISILINAISYQVV